MSPHEHAKQDICVVNKIIIEVYFASFVDPKVKYSQLDGLNCRLGAKLRCSDMTLLVTLQKAVSTFVSLLPHAERNRLHTDFTD